MLSLDPLADREMIIASGLGSSCPMGFFLCNVFCIKDWIVMSICSRFYCANHWIVVLKDSALLLESRVRLYAFSAQDPILLAFRYIVLCMNYIFLN